MAKTKVIAIVASAALVAVLGLSACGNQASSNSSASSSSATSSSASAEPSSASAESSSSASTSASSASAEDFLVSWRGTLDDGTLVNFIVSDDGKNAGIVLTQDGAEQPKKWVGALTTAEDGTMTITDAKSKDTVSFKFGEFTKDAPVAIEVEGYGKGELKPLTAADWKIVSYLEKLGKQK